MGFCFSIMSFFKLGPPGDSVTATFCETNNLVTTAQNGADCDKKCVQLVKLGTPHSPLGRVVTQSSRPERIQVGKCLQVRIRPKAHGLLKRDIWGRFYFGDHSRRGYWNTMSAILHCITHGILFQHQRWRLMTPGWSKSHNEERSS